MKRLARLRYLLPAAALLLAVAALAGGVRVPEGHRAAIGRAGWPNARVVEEGFRLRVPLLEASAVFSLEAVQAGGTVPYRSAQGADLKVPFHARMDPAGAGADAVLRWAWDGDLAAGARRAAEGIRPDPGDTGQSLEEIRSRLASSLDALGADPVSLSLGPPLPAREDLPAHLAALRAAWPGPRYPVLVIGIDSADWAVMDPMIRRGELPVLGALRDRGAWGGLRSMRPALSPILWTTIATGRTPDEHGVIDFLVNDPASGRQVPITSRFRRTQALWTILTDLGRPSLTVGWWATWPAERILGAMITDRVAYSLFDTGESPALLGAIYPPSLQEEIRSLVVEPEEISFEEIRRIVGIDRAEYRRARGSLDDSASWADPVAHLFRILASTRSYHEMAVTQIRRQQPPLALVYFEGLDEVNHRFAHYAPPAMRWADPGMIRAFEGAVEGFYRYQDQLVGELLEAADPETVTVVLSDHGFGWGDTRPTDVPPDIEGKPGRWHSMRGVIIAAGPAVTPGRLPRDPGLLDVAPTLLALLSLPGAGNMKGEVIREIAGEGKIPEPLFPTIASYERSRAAVDPSEIPSSPVDEEMLAKLTALGYVDSGIESPQDGRVDPGGQEGGPLTVTGHLNQGNILLRSGDAAAAEREYRAALDLAPAFVPARLGLAQALLETGRTEEGWEEMSACLREGSDLDAAIYMKIARLYRREDRAAEGARLFEEIPRRPGLEAARLTAAGILRSAAGETEAAEKLLRQALQEDPAFGEGLQEIYALMTRRGDLDPLAGMLEEAVRARPGGTLATNLLALTYERMGRIQEAIDRLEGILATSPRNIPTLANLSGLLLRRNRLEEALTHLTRLREVDPSNPEGLVNLVVAHGRLGNLAAAREAYASAGEASERPQLLNAMAYALFLAGAHDEAGDLLRRSLRSSPEQPEAQRLLSAVERELDR